MKYEEQRWPADFDKKPCPHECPWKHQKRHHHYKAKPRIPKKRQKNGLSSHKITPKRRKKIRKSV